MDETSSLMRIIFAALLAAGTPEPILNPTSEAFSAATSAKPSPVTATTF
jgi:hypothetical protein